MKSIIFLALLSCSIILSATIGDLSNNPKNISRSISSEEKNCGVDNVTEYHHSNENPLSENEYCAKTSITMIRRFCFKSGNLGFDNDGGLFGLPTGLCWWISQFHRKAIYLTYFDPSDTHTVTDDEFNSMIKKISNYEVVKIPGYSSFFDFMSDKKFPRRTFILKKFLQKRMAVGTIFKGEWTNGFDGQANIVVKNPSKLDDQRENQKKEFAEIYQMVRNPNPNKIELAYAMLQEVGLPAHSLLVYDAEMIKRDQYQDLIIYVQEPNYQTNNIRGRLSYYFDEESAQWYGEKSYLNLQKFRNEKIPFVIIRNHTPMTSKNETTKEVVISQEWTIKVQHEKDNEKINKAFKNFCKKDLFFE